MRRRIGAVSTRAGLAGVPPDSCSRRFFSSSQGADSVSSIRLRGGFAFSSRSSRLASIALRSRAAALYHNTFRPQKLRRPTTDTNDRDAPDPGTRRESLLPFPWCVWSPVLTCRRHYRGRFDEARSFAQGRGLEAEPHPGKPV